MSVNRNVISPGIVRAEHDTYPIHVVHARRKTGDILCSRPFAHVDKNTLGKALLQFLRGRAFVIASDTRSRISSQFRSEQKRGVTVDDFAVDACQSQLFEHVFITG